MKPLQSIPLRRAVVAFLSVLVLFYTTACNFYKVKVFHPEELVQIEALQVNKTLFLHNGNVSHFQIMDLGWKEDEKGKTIRMQLKKAVDIRKKKISNVPNVYADEPKKRIDTTTVIQPPYYYSPYDSKRYKPSKEPGLTQEVHFYLDETDVNLGEGINYFPIKAIKEIHVVSRDVGKSAGLTALVVVGTTAGILGLLVLIVALTKSSCPYVYAYDGGQFLFQGEIYSGAVLRNLERHDYLPMPLLKPMKGEYRVRIANELKERQFVNQAELIEVRHPQGSKVVLDEQGIPQMISAPRLPVSAVSAGGTDQRDKVGVADDHAFAFDEADAQHNSLTMSFLREPGAMRAKLVLNAKNSLWFDYLYGRFAEKMGANYSMFMSRLEAMTTQERQQQQISQDFPLSVYFKDEQGRWQLAGHLPLAGPLGWRDMVLPLDLAKAPAGQVEVRLETGYMFWEVNYAALDFSDNTGMEATIVKPRTVRDQSGQSQLSALRDDDGEYLRQLQTGNYAELHFKAMNAPSGVRQSLFLHTKGYYEHVRDFRNAPDVIGLAKFQQPHYFDRFSKEEFKRMQEVTWTAPDAEPLNK